MAAVSVVGSAANSVVGSAPNSVESSADAWARQSAVWRLVRAVNTIRRIVVRYGKDDRAASEDLVAGFDRAWTMMEYDG